MNQEGLAGMLGRAVTRAFVLDRPSSAEELMDTVPLSPRVVDETLGFLEFTNRRFGGTGIVLRTLQRWRGGWPDGRTITVLDVGTGAADIPRALVAWARSAGVDLKVTGIDAAPDIVAAARARVRDTPGISIEQADLSALSSSGRRFDYVTASLFLHHVAPDRTADALVALDRLATRGVIVGDLRRSPFSLIAVGVLSYVAGNAVVRHDGPLSVRRAFTVDELRRLAADLGLRYLRARPQGPFRVSLSGEKRDDD
jgi:2-polyprenyl-3-methyl-5-hydroxy-6-metoxy-1,4-benzoquinol methylase